MCGEVICFMGAFSSPKVASETLAAMSVAILHRGGLSSTIIKQPVFLTDLKIVLSSIGDSVLGSITSALIESSPSFSAA